MPTAAEHLAKATHNRRVLALLDLPRAADWAAVVAFYSALHQVERLTALDGLHLERHPDRFDYLWSHADHSQIVIDYRKLAEAAHVARYQPLAWFARHFPATYVRRTLIDSHLVAVEKYVDTVFSPPAAGNAP